MANAIELSTEQRVSWQIGFTFSLLCLVIQICFYILLRCSRKLDQKLLTQLTVARILNVAFEYAVTNKVNKDPWAKIVTYALYMQTDSALVCWMFIFTKNLYDNVIEVFVIKKTSFILVAVSIWIFSLIVGLLCPLLLTVNTDYFYIFYYVYGAVKFVILLVNLVFFCRIFKVALAKNIDNNMKGILKTCVVSFTLVSITSFQVLLTDLFSYFWKEQTQVSVVFGIINSYQAIAITCIFIILVNARCMQPLETAIATKLRICKG